MGVQRDLFQVCYQQRKKSAGAVSEECGSYPRPWDFVLLQPFCAPGAR